jgi:cysteinyl-tRNA synthetase
MTVRFFILQAHYRSPLDFSNDALQAAEKGMSKLLNATTTLQSLKANTESTVDIKVLEEKCYKAMNDDFNTPILIAHLFEAVRIVNSAKTGDEQLTKEDIQQLNQLFDTFVFNILGLQEDQDTKGNDLTKEVMNIILQLRGNAKANKDWTSADLIRDELKKLNIEVRDGSDGSSWEVKN